MIVLPFVLFFYQEKEKKNLLADNKVQLSDIVCHINICTFKSHIYVLQNILWEDKEL